MAPYPMSDPGWPPAEQEGPVSPAEKASPSPSAVRVESDFAELAAKFAAHGGDRFPADLSAELALEIVLNEIVEQACLATGATGAAIVLERDGEMVCRASSGRSAPELGSRLDAASGLSGECIRTGRPQRCDDAFTDPRADAAASQRLGAVSVLVMPLVGSAGVIGLFEVLSPYARAFGERDERIVEALAERVMKNLERAAEPLESLLAGHAEQAVVEEPVEELPQEGGSIEAESRAAGLSEEAALFGNPSSEQEDEQNAPVTNGEESELEDSPQQESVDVATAVPHRRVDVAAWVLSAVVLACVVLLAVLTVQRLHLLGSTTTPGRHAVRPASGAASAAAKPGIAAGASNAQNAVHNAVELSATSSTNARTATPTAPSGPAAGSLLVYENGKEVFRMPPAKGSSDKFSTPQVDAEQASPPMSQRVVALPSAAVDSKLIHRVEPDYPQEARDRQIQGEVVLDVLIGKDGTVEETKPISGEPVLAEAAIAAVRQWRFQPLVISGVPVEMQTRVTLNFRLSN